MMLPLDQTILTCCDWCEGILEPEQMDPVGGDDLLLCYDCYFLDYCETCSLCGESMEPGEVDQRYIAVMTDVDGDPCDVPAGIYEAVSMPYHTQNLVGGGWLWSDALRLIAPLEPDDDADPPCGHLCACCVLDEMHGYLSKCNDDIPFSCN